MKNLLYLLLACCVVSCQTTKIKQTNYKVSSSRVELGSIGTATSLSQFKHDFSTHTFPELHQKIRLDLQLLPFNQDMSKIYDDKVSRDQLKSKVTYVDSLDTKPKFATFTILDYSGILDELNAEHNRNVFTYLKDRGDAAMITSIAVVLTDEVLVKLQQADAFYLVNDQMAKYTVALYKDGKKSEIIDLQSGTVLAYTLGQFCWSVSDRNKWYIGDIVSDAKSCKGNTYKKIKKKEEANLFKM